MQTKQNKKIYVSVKQPSFFSDNGLSPGRRQAIIWKKAGILLIEPLGTNLGEILIEIFNIFKQKMHLKISYEKMQPSCLIFKCSLK